MELEEAKETEVITDQETTGTLTQEIEEKKFTQKDLDKIVQERLGKEKKKFQKEISEVERLAKLSAEEQEREKFKREKEEFENEKKLIQRERMEIQTAKELENLGIPNTLAKFVTSDEADQVQDNIKELKKVWAKALDEAVAKRIAGTTPKTSNIPTMSETEKMKKAMFEAAGLKYKG